MRKFVGIAIDQEHTKKMSSTKKNNQWYFGMKAHIGMDHKNKLVLSLATSNAKEHESRYSEALLHGDEEVASGDKTYSSIKRSVSSLRSRVMHGFHTIKCTFGYPRVRYKGLVKNKAQLYSMLMLAILYRVRRQLTG